MSEPPAKYGTSSLVSDLAPGPQRIFVLLATAGLVVSLCGCLVSVKHFFFSYLTAYSACLTLVLGMMCFVLLHYVADAGWSTVVRRPAEQFLATLAPLAVLLLPVLAGMTWLYRWTGSDDELTQAKAPYLNVPFFLIRAGVYFAVWLLIGYVFRGGSLQQDRTGDPQITLRLHAAWQ